MPALQEIDYQHFNIQILQEYCPLLILDRSTMEMAKGRHLSIVALHQVIRNGADRSAMRGLGVKILLQPLVDIIHYIYCIGRPYPMFLVGIKMILGRYAKRQ